MTRSNRSDQAFYRGGFEGKGEESIGILAAHSSLHGWQIHASEYRTVLYI